MLFEHLPQLILVQFRPGTTGKHQGELIEHSAHGIHGGSQLITEALILDLQPLYLGIEILLLLIADALHRRINRHRTLGNLKLTIGGYCPLKVDTEVRQRKGITPQVDIHNRLIKALLLPADMGNRILHRLPFQLEHRLHHLTGLSLAALVIFFDPCQQLQDSDPVPLTFHQCTHYQHHRGHRGDQQQLPQNHQNQGINLHHQLLPHPR